MRERQVAVSCNARGPSSGKTWYVAIADRAAVLRDDSDRYGLLPPALRRYGSNAYLLMFPTAFLSAPLSEIVPVS
jgi:hypothetical protein